MVQLTPIQLEDGTTIYIQAQETAEVSPRASEKTPQEQTRADLGKEEKGLREAIRSIPSAQTQAVQSFQAIETTIRAYTDYTLSAFKQVAGANIDKVTLEFGLKIAGKAGIPYITQGTAASNLKITVECSFTDSPTQTQVDQG